MSLPKPVPGLVIAYSYLWAEQHRRGLEEGVKARPCAIVTSKRVVAGVEIVTVVPVTHEPPSHPADALELPPALKAYLGLDDRRSWIVVTETNDFVWPGPDLRPVSRTQPNRFAYGVLPPRFFTALRDHLLAAQARRMLARVQRSE